MTSYAAKPEPVWYDPVCITTSFVYAYLAYLLFQKTSDITWYIVIASGLVSGMFRTTRFYNRMNGSCDLKYSFNCNRACSIMFAADLALAVIALVCHATKIKLMFGMPIIGLLICSWALYSQNFCETSCEVHSFTHIATCCILFLALVKLP
jgi:hypothetical protein